MVAYSFNRRFVGPIVAGLEPGPLLPGMKRQTIRGPRRRHALPGEELQLYTGMRTTSCKLLGRAVCEASQPVEIIIGDGGHVRVSVDGVEIQGRDLEAFARADGFRDLGDFHTWWDAARPREHGIEATVGYVLIRWRPTAGAPS